MAERADTLVEPKAEPKPGYKTTEFWLSLLAMLLGALISSGVLSDGSMAATIIGGVLALLGHAGYAVPRASVKGKQANAAALATAARNVALPSSSDPR